MSLSVDQLVARILDDDQQDLDNHQNGLENNLGNVVFKLSELKINKLSYVRNWFLPMIDLLNFM